ncbi:DEKNAAC100031 [Brettanomyces naardenensis]|uniref:DEKNAAC100031 n=1 Tax=Brettanomyces naardenensis TaxID=13370 RepID=A0A448YF62_BRENA|nr:DEKNAAC100031 [Brettanomyces naardenensis]
MESIDLSASRCYPVELPNLESPDARLRLDCRTGASIEIFQSRLFTFGGITVVLDLPPEFTTKDIEAQIRLALQKDENNESYGHPGHYNRYLSGEVFALSLIDHKWEHLSPKGNGGVCPEARMFHAMLVYDNYLYIGGGLRFGGSEGTKPEVLNDLWRFDLLDCKWKCLFENGNSGMEPRYNHQFAMMTSLQSVGFGLGADYGFVTVGGLDDQNRLYTGVSLCDLSKNTWFYRGETTLLEVGKSGEELLKSNLSDWQFVENSHSDSQEEGARRGYRASKNAVLLQNVSGFDQEMVCYDPSPLPNQWEPLVEFRGSGCGIRQEIGKAGSNSSKDFNSPQSKNIPLRLAYPNMATFGENIIIAGFLPGEHHMSAFIRNLRSHKWMRLQIKCFHSPLSHRLCKGFVWDSHHVMIFIGEQSREKHTNAPPSAQFFNHYLFVPLSFSSTFGIESETIVEPIPEEKQEGTKVDKLATSSTGVPAVASAASSSSLSFVPPASLPSSTTERNFVAYSNQIAPQLQVSSIKSIFPTVAVALSKNAFERADSFSDFEFVAADGTAVPVPITLCRRRWGKKFDSLLCEAYAWSYTDGQNPTALGVLHRETLRAGSSGSGGGQQRGTTDVRLSATASPYRMGSQSSAGSPGSSRDEFSLRSRSSDTTPLFRYPFQSKDRFGSTNSPPKQPQQYSSLGMSRRSSLNLTSLPTSVNRRGSSPRRSIASIGGESIPTPSGSRRSSMMAATGGFGSLGLSGSGPVGRRNSAEMIYSRNNSLSRRRSLGAPFSLGSPDLGLSPRRNSHRGSMLSRESTESLEGSDSGGSEPTFEGTAKRVLPTDSVHGTLPSSVRTQSNAASDSSSRIPHPIRVSPSDLPPQPPMPTVDFRGDPLELPVPSLTRESAASQPATLRESFASLASASTLASSTSAATGVSIASISTADPLDPSALPPPAPPTPHQRTPGLASYISLEGAIAFPEPEEAAVDLGRIPRALRLPYARPSVRALAEYLYTGQVGSSWKIFPTATDLLLLAKRYDVPMLYNLVLESLFVVLARKEVQLLKDANRLKQDIGTFGLQERFGTAFGAGSAIDRFSACLSKLDDGLMDRVLFKQASRVTRRASGGGSSTRQGSTRQGLTRQDTTRKGSFAPLEEVSEKVRENELEEKVRTSKVISPHSDTSSSSSTEESHTVKTTLGFLNEDVYETTDGDVEAAIADATLAKHFGERMSVSSSVFAGEIPPNDAKSGSKSAKEWPTFKELVGNDAAPCSDTILDMLVEVGALINDMKLMLRAINAKDMSAQLRKERKSVMAQLKADEEVEKVETAKVKAA